jgi:hypothetical protein
MANIVKLKVCSSRSVIPIVSCMYAALSERSLAPRHIATIQVCANTCILTGYGLHCNELRKSVSYIAQASS